MILPESDGKGNHFPCNLPSSFLPRPMRCGIPDRGEWDAATLWMAVLAETLRVSESAAVLRPATSTLSGAESGTAYVEFALEKAVDRGGRLDL